MEVDQETPQDDLRGEVLLEMRLLVANVVFLGKRATEIGKADEGFHFLQAS